MNILLVEDNNADAYLLMEYFEQRRMPRPAWVRDGHDALDFVLGKGEFSRVNRPDVILLDLGLPRISGYEAIRLIKNDPACQDIPIVVLTTSCNPLDARQCMDLGADAFYSKPRNIKGYEELTQQLAETELPRLTGMAVA